MIDPSAQQIVKKLPECVDAYELPDGLYLGTWRYGLVKVNLQTGQQETFNPFGKLGETAPIFHALAVAPALAGDSILICGTFENGYWYFNLYTKQFDAHLAYHDNKLNGLHETMILTFYVDSGGVLWAVHPDGISIIAPHWQQLVVQPLNLLPKGLKDLRVLDVLPHNTDADQIWLCVSYYGLVLYNMRTHQVEHWYHQSKQNQVQPVERLYHTTMGYDANKNLWSSHLDGMLVVNPKGQIRKLTSTVINSRTAAITKIKFDAQNIGWVATSVGLYMLDPVASTLTLVSPASLKVHDFVLDNSHLFLATNQGIFSYNLITHQLESTNIRNESIYSITGNGTQFFAASETSILLKDGSSPWRILCQIDDLNSTHALSMFVDMAGHLWLKTLGKVVKLSPETQEKTVFYASGYGFSEWFDGAYCIPTESGLTTFYPAKLSVQTTTQKSIITAVRSLDKRISVQDQTMQVFKWNQRSVSFDFTCPEFTSHKLTAIEFKLDGFDDAWRKAGELRSISYNNLEPGNYHFRVRAWNKDGKLHPEESTLSFRVLPPFYRTWQFIIAMTLLCIAAIMQLFRWRIQQIRLEEHRKREILQVKAETEMRALRAQMNPHFIFNCMNTIEAFIYEEKPDEASEFIQKFSKLIRSVLENAQTDAVLLTYDLEILEVYIQLEQTRANHNWQYAIELEPELSEKQYSIPPLLVQPFVENAIVHGLYHRKNPGGLLHIRAQADLTNQLLRITVTDNGVGRQEAALRRKHALGKRKSLGVAFTTERIAKMNEPDQSIFGVAYQDLHDAESDVASGTVVQLILPLMRIENSHLADKTMSITS